MEFLDSNIILFLFLLYFCNISNFRSIEHFSHKTGFVQQDTNIRHNIDS